eukprot:TRINITY_DN113177_c0_g1_i1.p1 TRINITY_DN113177_c0_g1~~TRINITY_DN113177_c0_g1_i1.p1  ORF type:complete len:324 (-),score=48.74 TRINITY_DN113177_c0_g1_i1:250-1221(-)
MLQIPALPRLDDKHKLGQMMQGPTEYSNWVIPGMLLCGAYPGSMDDRKNDQNLRRILGKGVDTFVCLQQELHDDAPEEVWREGGALRPYLHDAKRLTKKELKWVQLPIEDGEVAPDDVTAELVVLLENNMKEGRVIYLHCWGGHGRAGVVSCLLMSYLYRLSATDSMKRIQAYHDCRLDPQGVRSPQTVVQREQVKRQVGALLKCQPADVEIKKESARAVIDASKRVGGMMPSKGSAQTSSCPSIGKLDGSDSPKTKQRRQQLKALSDDRAMPDYLTLPQILPGAYSRREAILKQKSMAAAMRRRPAADRSAVDYMPMSALVV